MHLEAHDHYSGLHTTSLFVLAARSRGGLRRQGCIQAASLEPCCQKAAKPLAQPWVSGHGREICKGFVSRQQL